MGSVNRVILVGNLGKDSELRYAPGGAAVCSFSMATTEVFKDKEGQRKEQTEWHKVIVWGKTAEALNEYLVKGKQVFVEGKIQTRKWDKDGVTHYATEIKADRVTLLGGGNGQRSERRAEREPDEAVPTTTGYVPTDITDDDIPF